MRSNAVPGFLPSRHGFLFANRWPAAAARTRSLGLVHIGIGDTSRGLCGGMTFAARDRFERGADAPPDVVAPEPGTPLFIEIVDRQFASFGRLLGVPFVGVPLRFWAAALASERRRQRDTVRSAWPAIRSAIDAGRLSMVGLVRQAGWNPLALGLGHQVVAYRYAATPDRIAIGIYDPNHPGDDAVELVLERSTDGSIRMSQSTGEPLLGLLDLPYEAAR